MQTLHRILLLAVRLFCFESIVVLFLQEFLIANTGTTKKAVASVTGIGGMAGAIGGILLAWVSGNLFDHYKALGKIETGYYIMFIVC